MAIFRLFRQSLLPKKPILKNQRRLCYFFACAGNTTSKRVQQKKASIHPGSEHSQLRNLKNLLKLPLDFGISVNLLELDSKLRLGYICPCPLSGNFCGCSNPPKLYFVLPGAF